MAARPSRVPHPSHRHHPGLCAVDNTARVKVDQHNAEGSDQELEQTNGQVIVPEDGIHGSEEVGIQRSLEKGSVVEFSPIPYGHGPLVIASGILDGSIEPGAFLELAQIDQPQAQGEKEHNKNNDQLFFSHAAQRTSPPLSKKTVELSQFSTALRDDWP